MEFITNEIFINKKSFSFEALFEINQSHTDDIMKVNECAFKI